MIDLIICILESKPHQSSFVEGKKETQYINYTILDDQVCRQNFWLLSLEDYQ